MVSPSSKRRAAKVGIEGSGSSTALACRALGLTRSAYYRSSRESVQSRRIRKELIELSLKHPRYGYRRITALLRRDGFEINPKKVARIRREEGLKVSKRSEENPPSGSLHSRAAEGREAKARLELGLRGGPDRERESLQDPDLDR